MHVITATEARANIFRLMDHIAESHEPIMVTGRRCNSVMISEEDWRGIQETIYICSIPGMAKSLIAASNEPIEKGSEKLPWKSGNYTISFQK